MLWFFCATLSELAEHTRKATHLIIHVRILLRHLIQLWTTRILEIVLIVD